MSPTWPKNWELEETIQFSSIKKGRLKLDKSHA